MSLNGEADGPPMRVGVSIGDMVGGLYMALALRHSGGAERGGNENSTEDSQHREMLLDAAKNQHQDSSG